MTIYDTIKEQIKADFFQQYFPNDGQRFVAWNLRSIFFSAYNALSNSFLYHASLIGEANKINK
jgi:hypothetical protein